MSAAPRKLIVLSCWLCLCQGAHAATITIYRADGSEVAGRGPVGGVCLVELVDLPDAAAPDVHLYADSVALPSVEEAEGFLYRFDTGVKPREALIEADWIGIDGTLQYVQRTVDTQRIPVKLRIEIPEDLAPERTVYVTGNLVELGRSPDGTWSPRIFPLSHLGDGHWFGELGVGPRELVQFEITLGGWGTKGRDRLGKVIHVEHRIARPMELSTRVHHWGTRQGQPGDRPVHLSVGDPWGTTIVVALRSSSESRFLWEGGTPGSLVARRTRQDAGGIYREISKLSPGERRFYRTETGGRMLTFRVPPPDELTFCVVGDTKGTSKVLSALAERAHPDLVLDTGDLVNSGWHEQEWDRSLAAIHPIACQIPYMVAPGNHEEESPIFREAFHFPHREYYYAFTFGPARFLVIDSEAPYEPGTPQRSFAESVATSWSQTPGQIGFAVLHAPPYSSGKHGSDLNVRRELVPLFERADMAAVFSGHDHGYEATWPLQKHQISDTGTVYIVAAGGGAELYETRPRRGEWSRLRVEQHHWVTVRITSTEVLVQAMALDGHVFDEFNLAAPGRE